jgi:hypothetical protein
MNEDDAEGADGPGSAGAETEGTGGDHPSLDGMGIDEAVEAVVDADPDRDPETVRRALYYVSEDEVVTADAVDDALGKLSQVVATPETRLDLAQQALEEARETAEPVSDLSVVQARLDEYATELAALEDRLDGVQEQLGEAVERDPEDSLYAVGLDCAEVTGEANAVQQAVDEVYLELDREFDGWLTDPGIRAERLAEDADAVESMLDELKTVAEALDDAEEGEAPTLPDGETIEDPPVAWFDAALRVRLAGLLLTDLWAELDDLRDWADREGDERPDDASGDSRSALDDVNGRLDSLEVRTSGLEDWLAAIAKPTWRRRFGDRVATFEHAVSDRRPPVDWAAVQATLEEHRFAALDTT